MKNQTLKSVAFEWNVNSCFFMFNFYNYLIMKDFDEKKMKQLFAALGGNWEEFSNSPLGKGIIDGRPSISMTDDEDPSKDCVKYFKDDDECFDEFRKIIYYWNEACKKDHSYSMEFPKGEYWYNEESGKEEYDPGNYLLVFKGNKRIRMYSMTEEH